MGILQDKVDASNKRYVKDSVSVVKPDTGKDKVSPYNPSDEIKAATVSFLQDFRVGWQTMHLARPEFNDLSLFQRDIVDMLAFNTYQPNDGEPMMEDRLGGWRSNAIRPVIRNKATSIAAHVTARQIVPKIFAYNESDDESDDVAKMMSYIVDWAREQANYPYEALLRTIQSLYSPISWGYTEYSEAYRKVKDKKGPDGK